MQKIGLGSVCKPKLTVTKQIFVYPDVRTRAIAEVGSVFVNGSYRCKAVIASQVRSKQYLVLEGNQGICGAGHYGAD
ncbi:MAG: hypothetical protein IPJ25_11735 [Rhodocyclaceae bacterium]|nr:hypothetical protein [Rhodocyclaceae bacterium]